MAKKKTLKRVIEELTQALREALNGRTCIDACLLRHRWRKKQPKNVCDVCGWEDDSWSTDRDPRDPTPRIAANNSEPAREQRLAEFARARRVRRGR